MNAISIFLPLLLIAHTVHSMDECDGNGRSPFRFGEIKLRMPFTEQENQEAQCINRFNSGGDPNHHRARIIMARAIRLGRNPNEFKDMMVLQDYHLTRDLLEHGVSPNDGYNWNSGSQESFGEPLFFNAQSIPIAQLMIAHGADLSKRDRYGQTVLHRFWNDSYSPTLLAYYLKHHRAQFDINAQSSSGYMPLHDLALVCEMDSKNALVKAKILIAAGADLKARNTKGQTAYEICKNNERAQRRVDGYNELLAILNPNSQPQPAAGLPLSAPLVIASLMKAGCDVSAPCATPSGKEKVIGEKTECSICLHDIEPQRLETLPCTHSFCQKCIGDWRAAHDTCPLCRAKIT